MASESPAAYPLYGTTFNLHRVSPLYTGSNYPLDNRTLAHHAKRLRDVLAGDVLRGVRVGLDPEESALGNAGTLQTVAWKLLPDETEIIDNEDTTMSLAVSRGQIITIVYENITYTAILLQDPAAEELDESAIGVGVDGFGFEHLPLLLTKMRAPLRETFTDFLSITFDARVSTFHLADKYIIDQFERYLAHICIGEDGDAMDAVESSRTIRNVIGGVVIYISFDLPGLSTLKTVTIGLSEQDVPRIVALGKKIDKGTSDSPFMEALTIYAKKHLAMDLKHEKVFISSIACDAFVLGVEGKVKMAVPPMKDGGENPQWRATRRLVNGLVALAKGSKMVDS
ncbi:hypothetical protein G7Y89_g8911 [Cudoniella acicularis]|uniref:Uncharacterized protein n=1 Tax=Cudoniella acicularis TaxID=354080 RepID=A0A8H4RFP0_9HELO|nr:hypothetical protein G7Y89_g8911 [Cudoniella acicularis]